MTIQAIRSLTKPSLRLFIRLYQRTQKWERVSKLSYPDIAIDLGTTVDELALFNLVLTESTISSLREALDLLLLPELKGICKAATAISTGKREVIIDAIVKYCMTQVSCSLDSIAVGFKLLCFDNCDYEQTATI